MSDLKQRMSSIHAGDCIGFHTKLYSVAAGWIPWLLGQLGGRCTRMGGLQCSLEEFNAAVKGNQRRLSDDRCTYIAIRNWY